MRFSARSRTSIQYLIVFFCLLTVSASVAKAAVAACVTTTTPTVWQCWEHTLTSTKTPPFYSNAYRDVKLQVTFTHALPGSASETFTTLAFWDGDNNFKFRTAFPSTSTIAMPWHWTTSCLAGCSGDTSLTSPSGDVVVGSYSGSNRLYKGGFLRVGMNQRYLSLVNGLASTALPTPFFWVGDTAWNASVRAVTQLPGQSSKQEWETYVDSRRDKGFNVIQMALPVDYMSVGALANDGQPKDVQGVTPFTASSGVIPNNGSQWNPTYWKAFEQRIEYANEQGIAVLLVGLMERLIESNANYPAIADQRTYARNVVARLAGNFVIFSPGFDRDPNDWESPSCTTTGCRKLSDRIRESSPRSVRRAAGTW